MGLNPRHLKEFQGQRIYSSVILENVPQLAIQTVFLLRLGAFDEATFMALLSSSVSVVLSVVDIWSARQLVVVMEDKESGRAEGGSIEFVVRSSAEIEGKKRVLLTKPNAMGRAIAETLDIDGRTVEVHQLLASSEGIKVAFTVHAAGFNVHHSIDHLLQRRNRKKLEMLILSHWSLEMLPKCTMIRKGHRGTVTAAEHVESPSTANTDTAFTPTSAEGVGADSVGTATTNQPAARLPANPSFGRCSSNFKIMPLHKMSTVHRLDVRNYDPQLTALGTVQEEAVSPSSAIEQGAGWNEFVDGLQEYAHSQAAMDEAGTSSLHQIEDELAIDGAGNLSADELCAEYMRNIADLLEDKVMLSQQQSHRPLQSWNSVDTISAIYSQDSMEWQDEQ